MTGLPANRRLGDRAGWRTGEDPLPSEPAWGDSAGATGEDLGVLAERKERGGGLTAEWADNFLGPRAERTKYARFPE